MRTEQNKNVNTAKPRTKHSVEADSLRQFGLTSLTDICERKSLIELNFRPTSAIFMKSLASLRSMLA